MHPLIDRWRIVLACVAGAGLTLVACGDDANDAALRQQREADRIALIRSTSTIPVTSTTTTAPGTTTTNDEPATATTQPEPEITIEPTGVVVPVIALDNIFRPELIVVSVGDEVMWENRGQNDHDVLYVEGDDWGVEVEGFLPGDTYSHVFTEPGEYAYFCSIHGTETFGMIGTIVVEA